VTRGQLPQTAGGTVAAALPPFRPSELIDAEANLTGMTICSRSGYVLC